MNIFAKTAGVVLAAAALCGIGVGTAAAATSGQVSGTESAVTVYSGTLQPLGTALVPQFTCPPNYPWLYNANLSPNQQRVLRGVQVQSNGARGIDVAIDKAKTDAEGHVIGWNHPGTATNWDLQHHYLAISAQCTSDPTQAYKL
jgi:ABC-type phosphate transport system substrate-binding protein